MTNDPSTGDSSSTHPSNPLAKASSFLDFGNSLDAVLAEAGTLHGNERLALLRDDQHRRWRRGQRIPVEVYFERFPPLVEEEDIAVDLIYSEYLLRQEVGEAVELAEYCKRFPRYAAQLSEQFLLQQALGRTPGIALLSTQGANQTPPPTPRDAETPLSPLPVGDAHLSSPPRHGLPGYEILEKIGHGGMGVVYKARQVNTNRLVAIKMILAGDHARPEQLARLRAEANAIARLQHPHIVKVYEIGEHEGLPFFSMEYVEGGTLADQVRGGQSTPQQAARLLETLARAIHETHLRGIVHRDLKPGNVLLTKDGTPKLTDFGVAKRIDQKPARLTRSGALLGTPVYMSPEQATGSARQVGPRSDVYGLGAILYELLTGRPPFHFPTPPTSLLDALDRVRSWEPVSVKSIRPDVPNALQVICLKCLRKKPYERYSSALLLAEDCRAFLNGQPIQGRLAGPFRKTGRSLVKHLTRTAFTGVSFLAIAVTLLAAFWFQGRLDRERAANTHETAEVEVHALLDQIHEQSEERAPGWTWRVLDTIRLAAKLHPGRDAKYKLRTLAASCLASVDLRPHATLPFDARAVASATSLEGRRLALVVPGGNGDGPWAVRVVELPSGTTTGELQFLPRPGDEVAACAISPGGTKLAVGMRSGAIFYWAKVTDAPRPTEWAAHDGPITALAFHRDGEHLFSCSTDASVKKWGSAFNGKEAARYTASKPLHSITIQPGGDLLACSSSEHVFRLDLTSLQPRGTPIPVGAIKVCFSPDGELLAACAARQILLLDARTGGVIHRLDEPEPAEVAGSLTEVMEFSPDGSSLLSVARQGGNSSLTLWDVSNGKRLVSFAPCEGPVATFGGDGNTLYCGGTGRLIAYELAGRREQTLLAHHSGRVRAMDISPSDHSLTCLAGPTPGRATPEGEVTTWRLSNGQRLGRDVVPWTKGGSRPYSVTYSPRGDNLAVGGVGDRTQAVTRPEKGRPGLLLFPDADSLTFSPGSSRWWGVVEGRLQSWSTSGEKVAEPGFLEADTRVNCVATGSKWLVAGDRTGRLSIYEAGAGRPLQTFPGEGDPVLRVLPRWDDKQAVIGFQSGAVRIVRMADGVGLALPGGPQSAVAALSASRDWKLLATAAGPSVRLWVQDGETYRPLLTLRSATGPVTAACLSPNGRYLTTLVQNETAVRLWHLDRLLSRLARLGLDDR